MKTKREEFEALFSIMAKADVIFADIPLEAGGSERVAFDPKLFKCMAETFGRHAFVRGSCKWCKRDKVYGA